MNSEVKNWRNAILLAPARRISVRRRALFLLSRPARPPAPPQRIAAVEDQGDTRSGCRTGTRSHGAALEIPRSAKRSTPAAATTVSRSPTKASKEIVGGPVRQAVAAGVVADELCSSKLPSEVTPDRAIEVVFEMRHPVARLHERRPLADHRVGELGAVGRAAEAISCPGRRRRGPSRVGRPDPRAEGEHVTGWAMFLQLRGPRG